MGITVSNDVIDAALDVIATCTRLDITSDVSTPTDLSNTLANETMTAGDGNGDYTIADGDTSGRKVTMTAQSNITPTGTGTAKHLVLSLGGTIHYTTTVTDQALSPAATFDIPAFDHEIRDPQAE